ncbi:endo-1,4-beta-xylanase A precursor [Exidia glandulosa HHB12029]|uniref:Beta-xylanase n=1 Tax=Exidia glandulosa HHB12029 TaxID=1314781 RepID=A0A165P3G9_EXIGL|nr:endo-1,4-beta-xylanase A precursor [Exidia glandulosa HHB12029]
MLLFAAFLPVVSASAISSLFGLNTLAFLRGKYIGTASEAVNIQNATSFGKAYGALATSLEFGIYTNENNLKWEVTEPQPGVFNFTPAEKLFAIAEKTGKRMRGHTLAWHSQLAPWVEASNFTADELKAVLKRHILTEVGHFRGRVYAWDVVNEAFNDDGTFRESVWFTTLGEEYIELAFRWARQADPHAKLYINDFNFESISPKTDAAVALIKKLKAKGVPIDGVGAQSHLIVGSVPTDFKAALQRFADLGVDVALTELDIRGDLPETPEKLQQQAKDFRTAIDACLGVKRCVGVTLWQFTDALSWIPGVFPTQGFGTPLSDKLQKKPAYTAIRDALLLGH